MKVLKSLFVTLFALSAVVFGLLLLFQEEKVSKYVPIYDED